MKYRSIVISGPIASGTTTTAKAVAQKLNLPYESTGDFFRSYAIEHNIPLYDKEQVPDDIERKVDDEFVKKVQTGMVVDSHYAGYFNRDKKNVLKVLLTCDYQTRIKRALDRTHTHTETEEEIKKREEGLDKKFRKLYADENYLNPKFFDLVIGTTNTTIEEVVEQIIRKFNTPGVQQRS